jgi:CRISPR-associated endoribonuclease Cas6
MSEIVEQPSSPTRGSAEHAQKPNDLKGEHLHALLLKLRARSSGMLPPYAGQMAHASLLHWIAEVDPTCSALLHEPNTRRPFTCSSLWSPNALKPIALQKKHDRIILLPQHLYWLRLTILTEHLFQTFINRFFQTPSSLPEDTSRGPGFPLLRLGSILFEVLDIDGEPMAREQKQVPQWNGHTTYGELVEYAQHLDLRQARNRQIGLEFCSPTAFSNGQRLGGKQMWLFPDPERVFDSLARSWNHWAPASLILDLQELQAYIHEWVTVTSYQIETQTVHFDRVTQEGFVGRCIYILQEKPNHQVENLETRLTPAQSLHLLSRYALYAGVGYKTTMGMGQVRPLL